MIKIAPSILACDFARLAQEIQSMQSAGVELLHIDIMDGHFVPNLSLGIPVVASMRKITTLPFDLHLMVSDPFFYAPQFIAAGADSITFHIECECDTHLMIKKIRSLGKKVGISLKPKTPPETIYPYLPLVDMVLVMTVEPGFGGQTFMKELCPKIAAIRNNCNRLGLDTDIQVDGGIDNQTAPFVVKSGANILVAGSSLFTKPDYTAAVKQLRRSAEMCC